MLNVFSDFIDSAFWYINNVEQYTDLLYIALDTGLL